MAIKKHKLEIEKETHLHKIINEFSSHADIVKFALFCAKDCFLLNADPDEPLSQSCIQLVESWLANPHSVTNQQLKNAADAAYPITIPAAYTAAYAVTAVYADATACVYAAANAAWYASNAFRLASHSNQTILYQKLTQYTHYAYSLLRSTNITPTHTKGKIQDKATLMALLDELSELNEDLILHTNNLFTLNHPTNFVTNTLPELVNLIWNDSSLLHYLESLFASNPLEHVEKTTGT